MMDRLKLLALDDADLQVVSAHCQDAVVLASDIEVQGDKLALALNRYVWEKDRKRGLFSFAGKAPAERRRSMLHFERVNAVRSVGFNRGSDEALSLLAVTFSPDGDGPEGTLDLVFSGDAEMQIDVECIEARLTDTPAAWAAQGRPDHRGEGRG